MEFTGYSTLWKAIIRPPRAQYTPDKLGPHEFAMDGRRVCRTDFEVKNKRGLKFVCSHFEPLESERKWKEMPCIIYLHGNSSCRMEALDCIQYILPANMTFCCLDFPGCGLSEGEYISLGWHERDDVEVLIDYLRQHRHATTIGLWGRSMGAVTALMHGDRDPSIAGMVLDSPFADLRTLVTELGTTHTKIPKFLISTAMGFVRGSIRSRAEFDCYSLAPINHVEKCFIPALFATGNDDSFIKPHHTDELYKKYAGDKNVIKFEGDHNSNRPSFFMDSVSIFFQTTLQVDAILTSQNTMSEEDRKVFIKKMEDRRAE
jgi:pimeloyl-ACP methyl ester carboxylesterase